MEARGRALRSLADDVEPVADSDPRAATSPGWSEMCLVALLGLATPGDRLTSLAMKVI
jgi:hypothetical protein